MYPWRSVVHLPHVYCAIVRQSVLPCVSTLYTLWCLRPMCCVMNLPKTSGGMFARIAPTICTTKQSVVYLPHVSSCICATAQPSCGTFATGALQYSRFEHPVADSLRVPGCCLSRIFRLPNSLQNTRACCPCYCKTAHAQIHWQAQRKTKACS